MSQSVEHDLTPPPARAYRVGKYDDAWTRPRSRYGVPSASRYDDPIGKYRTIYAASTRYDAYIAALADFRPGPNSDVANKLLIEDEDAASLPTSQLDAVRSFLSRRYIGEGTLNGVFFDLTQESSLQFLRVRLATQLEKYGVTSFDADSLTYAPREMTMEISRCVYELEHRGFDRFDGLAYRSRLAGGMPRWAIFADGDGAPQTVTDTSSSRIALDDPDLVKAIRAYDIDAIFSSAGNVWRAHDD